MLSIKLLDYNGDLLWIGLPSELTSKELIEEACQIVFLVDEIEINRFAKNNW